MASFLRQIVDPSRPDGYGIWVFPYSTSSDRAPHLVAYGLGTTTQDSKVIFYLNPYNASTPSPAQKDAPWQKREIAVLKFPVALAYADFTGNDFNDIILTDQYGSSIFTDIWPHGGRVSWYENPGSLAETAHWKRRFIGKSPGMHRVKVGHFTRTDKIQVAGVPIVVAHGDFENPAPIIIYTPPDNPTSQPVDDDTVGWPSTIAGHFLLVHEVFVFKRENALDQIVLAGMEGISLLWYETETNTWQSLNLGRGLPPTPGKVFYGSGSVSVGKVGSDHAGYIASSEALHGNVVSVYTKPASSPQNTLSGVTWTRHVLENFGPLPDQTGSIHQVVCADIDGDGVDEILVALMGSDPPTWNRTGVWSFKLVDGVNGKFIGSKLSDESASMVVAGDFTNRELIDVATISYFVPNYFESPNPAVNLYASSPITARKLNEEVLFLIADPSKSQLIDEVEFLDVSSKKLSLVVLPPGSEFNVGNVEGVKVILGQLTWFDADGNLHSRTQAALPRTAVPNIVQSVDGKVQAGPNGAAFMLLKPSPNSTQPPYTDMSQLVAHNIFPPRFPANVRNMKFPWVKVEDRPWANGRFKDLEFYNLIGFHVKLASDSLQNVCHIQLWTAGVDVSAGFHNHIGDTFCEIHSCIVNGTGSGGMSWATVPDDQFDPNDPDPAKYQSLVVPGMHEHGPLWRTDNDGLPLFRTNASVDYPWHAWIAGGGSTQSFDVWLAFEFPPLTSVSLRDASIVPTDGVYKVCSSSTPLVAAVKDADPKDGTLILGVLSDPSKADQEWEVANISGTNTISIKNVGSGSFATSNWPPVPGQQLVGSRSLALLNTTSGWILTKKDQIIKIWLIGTKLVWTLNEDNLVVLETEDAGNTNQNWKLEPVAA